MTILGQHHIKSVSIRHLSVKFCVLCATSPTIPHPAVKITLLAWNGKFLLKARTRQPRTNLQSGRARPHHGSDAEVRELLDEEFLDAAIARFEAMRTDLLAAFARHELR
jgi:hypothetical protein